MADEKKMQEESSKAVEAEKKSYMGNCETIDFATLAIHPRGHPMR